MTNQENNPGRLLLYGLVIFISAFLLFQVQPVISKYILPWFGGVTTVWTTAQVFFQVMLLCGYGYAHLISRARLARQGQIHLVVLAAAGVWLAVTWAQWGAPLLPGEGWKPGGAGYPGWQVLGVLLVGVGGPYFLLATTSSLLQAWYGRLGQGRSPYAFYALSNAASLLALLSYPVLFEPNLALHGQAVGWAAGFGVYLALLVGVVAQALRVKDDHQDGQEQEEPEGQDSPGIEQPEWSAYLYWVGLAACGSTLSLAVTNQVTQDVASVPFLWVLPLSLYLLTYVLGFIDRVAKQKGIMVFLMLLALGAGAAIMVYRSQLGLSHQILVNCSVLFVVCLFCHSELYRSRPHPRHLTSFYLMISAGGALGGVLVSLVAPVLFRGFWEFPLALILSAFVLMKFLFYDTENALFRFRYILLLVIMMLETVILLVPAMTFASSLEVKRNFYGVLRIREDAYEIEGQPVKTYTLVHGAIVHGLQAITEPYRSLPTSYYGERSGAALAIRNAKARHNGQPLKVGIIGLGVGTLAAYGEKNDVYRFYEINPQVIELAQDDRFFSYLRDSQAEIEIVQGDARLSLEAEVAANEAPFYDILVIDAFSGDSIPTHLLSKQALDLYLDHLKPDGVIVFHISNRYINLEPVLWGLVQDRGVFGAVIVGGGENDLQYYSRWVMVTREDELLRQPEIADQKREFTIIPGLRLWTDDYSTLFQVLR